MFHDTKMIRDAAAKAPFALARPELYLPRRKLLRGAFRDNMLTFDSATIDSTGVFLLSELEKLDPMLHMPLVAYKWSRDIDVRGDVTMGDEDSSFTNSSFAAVGGLIPGGKAWAGSRTNGATEISLDIGKTKNPLTLWNMMMSWTIPELEKAKILGRPIDTQKIEGLMLKWNMDVDEQTYIGDTSLGVYGMFNSAAVTPTNVVSGAAGTATWETKSPDEILTDVNTALTTTWANAGYAVMPNRLMLPPQKYSYIVQQKVSAAGNMSIMNYIAENNIAKQQNMQLDILESKWLVGGGSGGTLGDITTVNRMVVYNKDPQRIRLPLVPLQKTPVEWRSLYQMITYYGRIGVVEIVYPECVGYYDGI